MVLLGNIEYGSGVVERTQYVTHETTKIFAASYPQLDDANEASRLCATRCCLKGLFPKAFDSVWRRGFLESLSPALYPQIIKSASGLIHRLGSPGNAWKHYQKRFGWTRKG